MKILITGGTGFIGRAAARELAKGGHELLLLGRSAGRAEKDVRFLEGDLIACGRLKEGIAAFGPDAALHLAWEGLPDYSANASVKNLVQGLSLFEALLDAGCKKIVAAGSCWEYGREQGRLSEELPVVARSPFTAAKNALHEMGREMARERGAAFVWARLFYVYGPGQRSGSVIPYALACLREGRPVALKTPHARNDFIHVEDVARALRIILERQEESGVINVGSGASTEIARIVDMLHRLLGREFAGANHAGGEAIDFCADTAKLRALGWSPQLTLEAGVRTLLKERENHVA